MVAPYQGRPYSVAGVTGSPTPASPLSARMLPWMPSIDHLEAMRGACERVYDVAGCTAQAKADSAPARAPNPDVYLKEGPSERLQAGI